MRNTKVVSISLPAEMLEVAESIARQENRTMSELMREALRAYQRQRQSWQNVFAYGEANARRLGIQDEQDVVRAVREQRQRKRKTRSTGRKPGAR
jgi:CopG family transcriptional regulator/antitoxin EndoAI